LCRSGSWSLVPHAIARFELLYSGPFESLVGQVAADIGSVSPETQVVRMRSRRKYCRTFRTDVDASIWRHRLRAPTILDAGSAGQAARVGPYQGPHGAWQAFSPEMSHISACRVSPALARGDAARATVASRQANIDSSNGSEKRSKNTLSDKYFHFPDKHAHLPWRFALDTKSYCDAEGGSWRLRQIVRWSC
jgi:hypothetical protein